MLTLKACGSGWTPARDAYNGLASFPVSQTVVREHFCNYCATRISTVLGTDAFSPTVNAVGPYTVGRDTRVYLESPDDHRMSLPAHMARAVLEAYPDDEPVVSPDPGWRAS
jgi:hypothetical protein